METIWESSLQFTRLLQLNLPQLEPLMRFFSSAGFYGAFTTLILYIFWCRDKLLGVQLLYLAAVTNLLISFIKHAGGQPRPYWLDQSLLIGDASNGFGFASGHVAISSIVVITYVLAVWRKRLWVIFAGLAYIATMMLSRMYLGQHFWHDTTFGFLIGCAVYAGFFVWQEYYQEDFEERILGQRFWLAVATPVGFGLFYLLLALFFPLFDPMPAWGDLYETANINSFSSMSVGLFLLLGVGAGYIIEESRVRTTVDGAVGRRFVRLVVGFGLLLGSAYLMLQLSLLIEGVAENWIVDAVSNGIFAFVIGFVITYLIPLVFRAINLSSHAPRPEIKATINRLMPRR